jgi:predicted 2-oxoglutarate/Fe(II)-dependent dioxygenase YbiX
MQSTLDTIIKYDILSKRQIKVFYNLLKYEDFQNNIYSNDTSYHFLEVTEAKSLKSEFVYETILDIDKMLIDYVERLYKVKVTVRVGRSILRYTNDKFIKLHRDIEANTERPVQLSSVLYLNDNYLGGEIFFLDNKKNKILEFKPQAGSVIFFDSAHLHGTNPIVSGVKYCYNSLYCF